MHKTTSWLCALAGASIILIGCSGSGGASATTSNQYRTEIGSFTRPDIVRVSNEALVLRYGFSIDRQVDSAEDIRIETAWKNEAALPDERELGYEFVRTRITITARPRSRSAGLAGSYSARYRAEALAQKMGLTTWEKAPLTDERKKELKEIVDWIRSELRTGFRSF